MSQLAGTPPPAEGRPRDGMDVLLDRVGESQGPAVVLSALLQALGERARVETAAGAPFVRVALDPEDLGRLPPYARLTYGRGRFYIPLDPRQSRSPLGFLAGPAGRALAGG